MNTVQTNPVIQAQKQIVKAIALEEIALFGQTTTLEIKTRAINDYPGFHWTQDTVSNIMNELFKENVFAYTDIETDGRKHRQYYIPVAIANTTQMSTVAPIGSTTKISRTKLVEALVQVKGKFITITFIKKSGNEAGKKRTINCQYQHQTPLGHLQVYSIADKGIRTIDPHTLLGASFNGKRYEVKS